MSSSELCVHVGGLEQSRSPSAMGVGPTRSAGATQSRDPPPCAGRASASVRRGAVTSAPAVPCTTHAHSHAHTRTRHTNSALHMHTYTYTPTCTHHTRSTCYMHTYTYTHTAHTTDTRTHPTHAHHTRPAARASYPGLSPPLPGRGSVPRARQCARSRPRLAPLAPRGPFRRCRGAWEPESGLWRVAWAGTGLIAHRLTSGCRACVNSDEDSLCAHTHAAYTHHTHAHILFMPLLQRTLTNTSKDKHLLGILKCSSLFYYFMFFSCTT